MHEIQPCAKSRKVKKIKIMGKESNLYPNLRCNLMKLLILKVKFD